MSETHEQSGVPISKGLLLLNSTSTALAWTANLGLLVWLQQYLLSRIPPAEYSLYPVFTSILLFLLVVKAVFTGGIARYLMAARSHNDTESVSEIVSTTFVLNVGIAAVFLAIGLPIAANIERVITVAPGYYTDARIMMGVMVASFALRIALASFESGLVVEQRFVTISAVNLSQTVLRLILLLILVVGISPRVIWVAFATEGANVAGIAATVVLSRRAVPSLRFNWRSVRLARLPQLLSFGSWTFVMHVANRIRMAADPIILNQLAGPMDVTIFYIGNLVPKNLTMVSGNATMAILPSLTAMHETGQQQRLRNTYHRYGRVMSWIILVVATPLVVLRREIIELYVGNRFAGAAVVLLMLMVATVIEQSYSALPKAAYAMARMRGVSLLSVVAQIVNLGLTIVLVGAFSMGAFGAALSTLLVRGGFELVAFSWFGTALLGVDYGRWLRDALGRGLLPALAAAPVMYALRALSPVDTWTAVAWQSAVGIAVFVAALLLLAAAREDRADLMRLARWAVKSLRPATGGRTAGS